MVVTGQHRLGGLTSATFNSVDYTAIIYHELTTGGVTIALADIQVTASVETQLSALQIFNIVSLATTAPSRKLLQTGAMLISYKVTTTGSQAQTLSTLMSSLNFASFSPLGITSFTATVTPKVAIATTSSPATSAGLSRTALYGIVAGVVGGALVVGGAVYFVFFSKTKKSKKTGITQRSSFWNRRSASMRVVPLESAEVNI